MRFDRKKSILLALTLSVMALSHSCKTGSPSSARVKSTASNAFTDGDVTGPDSAQQQELAQLLQKRKNLAQTFNNDFNSVMTRILRSQQNESYLKVLKNYYQGNLIGTFTRQEYETFEATWNTMRLMKDQVSANERRIQEILVGKVDGPSLGQIMLPYNVRLRVVLKAMEPGLQKNYGQVLIEDAGEFLNFVSDTTAAQAGAALAYTNEVLNSLYPPSREIYQQNVAQIRRVQEYALTQFIPNINGIAADIVGGLPQSMQVEAAARLTSPEVAEQVQNFWRDDVDALLKYYNPEGASFNLSGEGSPGIVGKSWNWFAALPFKGVSFNAGALGVFSAGVKKFYGQYTKRYRYLGNGNLEFCTNWTAKVGGGAGLGSYVGVPFGMGFQWDYEMFERGSLLNKISHFALIKTLTGMDSGLDYGIGFDVGLKIPVLPGVIGNAYYSPSGDIIGGDIQGLWIPGMGKTAFVGASAQIHSNLACTNRGTHWDHWQWIKDKAKQKWKESGDWVKGKVKENIPDWSSALGLNKITIADVIEAKEKQGQ